MADIDTELETALAQSEPPIGDDGFTDNVMARLPFRAPARVRSERWMLAGAAAVGSIATLVLAPPVESAFGLLALPAGTQTLILTAGAFVAVVGVPLCWLFGGRILAALRWANAGMGGQ